VDGGGTPEICRRPLFESGKDPAPEVEGAGACDALGMWGQRAALLNNRRLAMFR
jgi:hypothetical protein